MPNDVPVDELDDAQIEQLHAEALDQLATLRARFRGLVPLTDKARAKHPGRYLVPLIPALQSLFKAMVPNSKDDPATAKTRASFAQQFDVHGAEDAGRDPERFEYELLLRRLRRITLQQQLADELQAWGRLLDDDALHTSEAVLIAGNLALDTVRSIGENNAKYGAFVTPVFNALRSLTKAAQARLVELRAERAAKAKPAEPKVP